MDIGANFSKGGVGIGVWYVFASEDWDIAVCAMYILFYTTDPIEWDKSAKFHTW
jgi:hypothetical protein